MEYTDMERRILDMWPKFEDGAYVMYEDEFDFDGEVKTAYGFNFGVSGRVSIWTDKGSHVRLPNGERVKRPAPKVLDADGVEIEVGDRIYSIVNGNSYTVRSINGSGTIELEGFEYKGWSPKFFTHMQPAIDADGVLIKVGDTVWVDEDTELLVEEVNRYGARCFDGEIRRTLDPKSLTHTQPDSWERLERDADNGPCGYFDFNGKECTGCPAFGSGKPCISAVCTDIVRRAKALAEKEAAR